MSAMATMLLKTKAMQVAEHRLGRPLEKWIAAQYADGATQAEIAARLSVNTATVSRWMYQLGLEAHYGPKKRRAA